MKFFRLSKFILLFTFIFLVIDGSSWAIAREPCNRYRYYGKPNPNYPNGTQYVCKHDLENNSDQFNEFYTYKAWKMDGYTFQHQDEFRKRSLFLFYYYGLIRPNGYWQWQQTERYDSGNYNSEGITKKHQFAMQHSNGAWQNEYAWRNSPSGYYNYCYAQSAFDELGRSRAAKYFCNIDEVRVSGDYSPVPLRNPSFRNHQDLIVWHGSIEGNGLRAIGVT
jgi:hypothetical protein